MLVKVKASSYYGPPCIISNELHCTVIIKWLGCTKHMIFIDTQTYSAYLYTHSPVMWFCSNSRGIHSTIFILRSRAVLLCSSSIKNFSCVAVCWSAATTASLTRIQSLQMATDDATWLRKVVTVGETKTISITIQRNRQVGFLRPSISKILYLHLHAQKLSPAITCLIISCTNFKLCIHEI